MQKALTYIGFLGASTLSVWVFVTADTYIQLIAASVLYMLIVFTAYKFFVSRKSEASASVQAGFIPNTSTAASAATNTTNDAQPETVQVEKEKENISITDIDKRVFLKLIGATGLSFFLYSILSKRSETTFFGKASEPGTTSLEDSSGKTINPAEHQPTDSY